MVVVGTLNNNSRIADYVDQDSDSEGSISDFLDSITVGDEIVKKKSGDIRVVSGNINGFQLAKGKGKLDQTLQEVTNLEIDHIGFSEINSDTTSFEVNDLIHSSIKKSFKTSAFKASSTSLRAKAFYKPGGTMSLVHNDLVGRVVDRGGDDMGRWTFIRYAGKNDKFLTIVTVYQVCEKPTNEHGVAAFHQQTNILVSRKEKNHSPRHHFRKDLLSTLRAFKQQGDSVVLSGDFNEDVTDPDSPLHPLFTDPRLGFVDVIGDRFPEAVELKTYTRGSTRLDFMLVTRDLVASVTRCGYLPFQSHFRSDHRFVYIDLDVKHCLGSKTHELSPPAFRDFCSKDISAVKTYIKQKHKFLTDHNVFRRVDRLAAADVHDHALAEKLDKLIVQGSLLAGKKCRKRRRSWWSIPLHQALEKKCLLQTMITGFTTGNIKNFNKIAKKRQWATQVEMELPGSLPEARKKLREIQEEITVIRAQSKSYRETSMHARAEQLAADGSQKQASIVKRILQMEQQAERWRRINSIQGNVRSKGISSLQVPRSWPVTEDGFRENDIENPKKCNDWKKVEAPKEIEFYLRMRNLKHFGQAQGTPFTVPPLSQRFNWEANTAENELILKGDFDGDELDDIQQLFLEHCKSETGNILSHAIDKESLRKRLLRWEESTTTSPSGMHLGHAKALVVDLHISDEDEEGLKLVELQKELFLVHWKMVNYAFQHGYSFERWKQIVNVMIEKDPGNTQIHRLRVIHLYEFDLGACMALLWKEMLADSEKRGTINDGQFGGRKGREATNLALAEEIKVDICLASRKSLVNFDNDAASCYDRILPSIASMLGRKKGLHRLVTLVHATTLKEAKYKLKTALGISEEAYSHDDAFPIYGTGQGSTNSPIIWIIVSSTLFDIHMKKANGATFCTPDKSVEIAFSIVGFVDDSNCQTNSFLAHPQPEPDVLAKLAQEDAKLWSYLLWISGGYLELPKCSYHFIHFDFNSEGKAYMRGGKVGPPIEIKDDQTGAPIQIPAKSVFDPHKTLGHYKAPAGKSSLQFGKLKEASDKLAKQVLSSPLTRQESMMLYSAVWLARMRYVLPQCSLSPAQLKTIESKAMMAFVAKGGYARTMALPIRFGPKKLGGAGFIQLETIQGEGQILNVLKHWRSEGKISDLLRCAVAWGQFQAGTGQPILSAPEKCIPYFAQRYLKSVRNFLASIGGKIELDTSFVPELQRTNDFYLMDHALWCNKFNAKQLEMVNNCRLYLQVVTAADIVLPNGTDIDEWMRQGTLHPDSSSTRYVKIEQARPNQKAWMQWKVLCASIKQEFYLKPLGQWLLPASKLRRHWPAYYDLKRKWLYVHSSDGYMQYAVNQNRDFDHGLLCPEWGPNDHSVPVQAEASRGGVYFVDFENVSTISACNSPSVASTFEEYIDDLPEWDRTLFQWLEFLDCEPFDLMEALRDDAEAGIEIIFVSDGSAGDGSMSFGWVMSTSDGARMVRCAGPAFGTPATSYRSEAYGILSAVRFVYHVFRFCCISPLWKTNYHADNIGILKALIKDMQFEEPWPNTTLEPDWDLRNEIKRTLRLIGQPHAFTHVKGHQDSGAAVETLTLPAQLNVEADALAGDFRKQFLQVRSVVPRLGHNRAQLSIGGKTVTSQYRRAIREAKTAVQLLDYIQAKYEWSDAELQSVDWLAHERALNKMSNKEVSVRKLIFNILPTAYRVNKYDPSVSPKCPRCKLEDETVDHLVKCQDEVCKKWRANLITDLRGKCETLYTREVLFDVLLQGLKSWLDGEPLDKTKFHRCVHQLIDAQTAVGWDQLLRGRFVLEWSRLQQDHIRSCHLATTNKTLSGVGWVASIVAHIWTATLELWDNRNQFVFGEDATTSTSIQKARLLEALKSLHARRETFLQSHRQYLIAKTDADDHKLEEFVSRSNVYRIRNWVDWWKPVFVAGAKEVVARSIARVQPIYEFFPVLSRVIRRKEVSAEEEVMAQQASAAPIPRDRDDLGSRDIRVMFGHSVPLNETATPEREEPQKKAKKRYDPRSIDIRTIFRR